jgi:hypothetical protein
MTLLSSAIFHRFYCGRETTRLSAFVGAKLAGFKKMKNSDDFSPVSDGVGSEGKPKNQQTIPKKTTRVL